MKNKHLQCVGPIILSALSLLISFLILQPLALYFGSEFNLLESRGIGKVIFISMVIYQILLFILLQKKSFQKNFLSTNLLFLYKEKWVKTFLQFFSVFFMLHSLVLLSFYVLGYATYSPNYIFNAQVAGKTLFGFFVVFMLAWTEELIFRGTIYPYFLQFYNPIPSMLITSTIFMLVHNLRNPLALVTTDWKLGLGLFLLGLLLNQVFCITKKLYTGMGIHGGLVFVKVVLRRMPFLTFVPASVLPWFIDKDLRQSIVVHILFIIAIVFVFVRYKEKFTSRSA